MRRPVLVPLIALALGGCAKKPPEDIYDRAAALDWPAMPRVPSPDASAYSAGKEAPRDPQLYSLLDGFHHDGSLAAAATALALDMAQSKGDLSRWTLREAAWRGGWPYPVQEARAWRSWSGSVPPRDMLAWLDALPRTTPMALVRARGHQEDVWVGLKAIPPADLGALPRMAALGTPMALPALPYGTYTVADPGGTLKRGTLESGATILLQRTGEWLVVVRADDKEIGRFPIYVDIPAPTEAVLALRDPPPVADADDADALAEELIDQIRDAWDLPRWTRSPVFDAATRAYVEDPSKGSAGVLTGIGYAGVDAVAWACDDVTVQNCLDQWLWDPRRRASLVSRSVDSFGLHASLDDRGIHLTLLLVDAS